MRGLTGMWGPRLLLVAMVALPALSACSDPEKPGVVARPTPNKASSTPSPSPATPEAQVEAAVRAYYAELTRAAQTNDTTRLKQLVDTKCPCYGSARSIDEVASKGMRTPNATWTVASVHVHDIFGKTAAAEVSYAVNAYEVVRSDGSVANEIPARQNRVDLSLVRGQAGWLLANVFDLGGR